MAQPEQRVERQPAIKLAASFAPCDACGDDEGSPYHDLHALVLCDECAEHLDKERRIHSHGWSGPMPKLTAYRLGLLSSSFTAPKLARKLERLAAEMQ